MTATTSRTFTRAFSTLGCADLPLEKIFDLAQRHGIPSVELRAMDGTINLTERLENIFLFHKDFAGRIEQTPVRICSLDTSFRLSENTDAERTALLRFVPWAEAAGIPRLRVFDGAGFNENPGLTRALDTLDWWCDLRSARGWRVDLMIETHDSLLRAPLILRFLERAPTGTAILWDSHHTWRLGGETPTDTWRAIGPHVVHIHVKDSVSKRDGHNAYTYIPCGQGEFPMADLLKALSKDAYSGVVSLEWERLWHPGIPPLEESLSSASTHNWW
ncbi:sugar phosphate isomerase/epimerase family protein [Rariglobus hedericola]|uniref:Sugar phosphate isomerase/epimerase n=1 Tax=Rariglobus hedericola TaxID=2597822 RepID=A0A556QP52_9BACT|nr:TIM barrel protein [Rariglobus hedericola]TSJ78426.1 sugar phosphate isomerase/epimerase [Rariglobus hedericola]